MPRRAKPVLHHRRIHGRPVDSSSPRHDDNLHGRSPKCLPAPSERRKHPRGDGSTVRRPKPHSNPILIQTRFWERALKFSTPEGALHFANCFNQYLESVVELAEWRDADFTALTIEKYIAIRLRDVGVFPTQAICGLHLSIPEDVFADTVVSDIVRIACELSIIDNVSAEPHKRCSTVPLT